MGTMNESEARRAALTAAIAWCSTPSMDLSTDALLGYAEKFETWLLRPELPDVELCPVCDLAVTGCGHTPSVGTGTWCPACNFVVAWCIHTTVVDSIPVDVPKQREAPSRPVDREASPCPCTFRSSHTACASCDHDAHDPGKCASTAAYAVPEPVVTIPEEQDAEAPVCPSCGHPVSMHTSHGCTHGRGHMDSGWENSCMCPYRAVDFRNGAAPSGDGPEPEPNKCTCTFRTKYWPLCPGCGHARHEPNQCSAAMCGPVTR